MKPRPEAVLGDRQQWQHSHELPEIDEPSANPNARTTKALHGNSELEKIARVVASIGGVWNSKRPKQITKKEVYAIEYFYGAQEIRNRILSAELGYSMPTGIAAEHLAISHAKGNRKDIWKDIAYILHDPQLTADYLENLKKLNPIIGAEMANQIRLLTSYTKNPKLTTLHKRQTDQIVKQIAWTLFTLQANYDLASASAQKEQRKQQRQAKNKNKPGKSNTGDLWHELRPLINKLTVPHKGTQQPKKIITNQGKNPSRIANYYTDPMRRVFTRKTKYKGALVIVDTSGSMQFDDNLLNEIMEASKGATVISYGMANHHNVQLIADKGKRVKYLPKTGGNNGVDCPAIRWAIKNFRRNRKQQTILISDGYAIGRRQDSDEQCRRELRQLIAQQNIHMESNIRIAIKKLSNPTNKLKCNPESVPL